LLALILKISYYRVTLIYDHYGSLLIRNKHIKALKDAGASKIQP